MKKYYDPENTPLKFHDFVVYISVPLAIISNLIITLSTISNITAWSNAYVLAIGINLLDVAFSIVMFIGLLKWKAYGWVTVMIYAGIIGYNALSDTLKYWSISPEAVGAAIPKLIYMILLAIDYAKRRALYFKGSRKQPTTIIQPIGTLNNNTPNEIQPIIEPVEIKEAEESKKRDEIFNQIIQPKRSFKLQSKVFNGVIIAALVIVGIFAIMSQKAAATSRAEATSLKEQIRVKDSEIVTLKSTIDSRKRDISALQSKIYSLQNENDSLSTSADFMEYHVVIVPDDGSNIYHKYGCPRLNTSSGFWIYNTENAKYNGYRPCSYCSN